MAEGESFSESVECGMLRESRSVNRLSVVG